MKPAIRDLKELISEVIKEYHEPKPETVKGQAPKVGDWVYILGYDGGARRYETELRDGKVFYKKVKITSTRAGGPARRVYFSLSSGMPGEAMEKNVRVAVDQTSTNKRIA